MGLLDIRRRILLNTPHLETASGDIATFETDMVAPLHKLTVDIEPVQDLNGYDHPWPPGGGKNLCPDTWEVGAITGTTQSQIGTTYQSHKDNSLTNRIRISDLIYLDPSSSYTVSVASSYEYVLQPYDANGLAVYTDQSLGFGVWKTTAFTVSGVESLAIAIRRSDNATMTAAEYKSAKPQIEKGSTPTSYAPYSNICPIEGWEGSKIEQTGKNLFGGQVFAEAVLASTNSDVTQTGDIVFLPRGANNVKTSTSARTPMFLDEFNDGQYTIIIGQGSTSVTKSLISAYYTDGSYTSIGASFYDSSSKCWIYHSNLSKKLWFIRLNKDDASPIEYDISRTGFFEGNIGISDFAPYSGTTIPITFTDPDSGDPMTVYGGTLTINADGSGVLTATDALKEITSATPKASFSANNAGRYRANYSLGSAYLAKANLTAGQIMSNSLARQNSSNIVNYASAYSIGCHPNGASCYITLSSSQNTIELFNDYLDSIGTIQLWYPLKTPITYTLDPAEVVLTLKGTNNIWADTGSVTAEFWKH